MGGSGSPKGWSEGAMVIPDADEALFGALCMKALDVMPDPIDECLKGRHGDKAVYKVK
jgi:hypothetical protein